MDEVNFANNRWETPVSTMLRDKALYELFQDGASKYWAGQEGVEKMLDVLSGEKKSARVEAIDEWTGQPNPEEAGDFTVEKFREALIQAAVFTFLQNYDSVDIDVAIQLAVFGEVVFG